MTVITHRSTPCGTRKPLTGAHVQRQIINCMYFSSFARSQHRSGQAQGCQCHGEQIHLPEGPAGSAGLQTTETVHSSWFNCIPLAQ